MDFTVRVLIFVTRSPRIEVFSPSCGILLPVFDKVSPTLTLTFAHFSFIYAQTQSANLIIPYPPTKTSRKTSKFVENIDKHMKE